MRRLHDLRTRRAGLLQVLLYLACYILYLRARGLSGATAHTAVANARKVWHLEQTLRLAVEPWMQHTAAHIPGLQALLSFCYMGAQVVVVPAVLIWLWRTNRAVYRQLAGTVILTWLAGVVAFTLFPCAPPRLAHLGLADIVSEKVIPLGSQTVGTFYDPYAAMPSIHAGFACAVSAALFCALPGRWRYVALIWGPLIIAAILVTGNHFVLDAVGGVLLVAAAGAVVAVSHRALVRRPAPTEATPAAETA